MYFRIAGYMTAVAITAKLILFLLDTSQQSMAMTTMFVNLLVVLVGSFFAVRYYKAKNPSSDIKSEVKAGMRATTLFALFLSIFVLVYYNYIDTHYFPNMIDARVALAETEKANYPDIDVVGKAREFGEMFFSARTHATLTLFGVTIVGALYSIVLVIILKKMGVKNR